MSGSGHLVLWLQLPSVSRPNTLASGLRSHWLLWLLVYCWRDRVPLLRFNGSPHRQPQDRPVPPHGDVAPRWQGAGRGRRAGPRKPSRERRTLRSGHRHLFRHEQPQHRARRPYRNSPAQWPGACRGRKEDPSRRLFSQRGTL